MDLHARSLFLVVLDRAVRPFRDGLVVGCECMHCRYWLADACRDHTIAFALGHAWAMKAVHGSKTKGDRACFR